MKLNSNSKNAFIEVTCLLYILLFVYAAMNKGLDFEKFQVQLAQSPLMSAFAGWISWTVLIAEFGIVIFLLFPKTKIKGLYAGFCLMAMFTAYIFVMLHYSSFLPCSCGGILEKMGWDEHLLFNIFFVIIGGVALWIHHRHTSKRDVFLYALRLFIALLGSVLIVIVLFLSSEEIMHRQNPFIRRYPHHPVTLKHTIDLKFNSYYFAGSGNGKVYFGNATAPLYVLSVDSKSRQQVIRAKIDLDTFSKSIRMIVHPPYFYLADGKTPVIFRGKITNWRAELQHPKPSYFNIMAVIDSSTIAFRGVSKTTGNNILGIFKWGKEPKTSMAPLLLQKQIDGVFDTDGMLHYSSEMKRIIYIYSYRNEYIVADRSGGLDYRGHTIDTVSQAKIKVAFLKNKTEKTMAMPAISVNASSNVCRHLLFVNSNVPGRFEKKKMWEETSVIDVYDLNKKMYLFSFHLYPVEGKKIRSFVVTTDYLYALADTKLVMYQLNDELRKEMKNVSKKNY